MASNTGQTGYLPTGAALFCTIPDIFYVVELVFGGLVLCLVASTKLVSPFEIAVLPNSDLTGLLTVSTPSNPQAYVITVTIFCFLMTFTWLIVFGTGCHRNKSSWASADVACHGFASLLYLSASVLLALVTIAFGLVNKDAINYKLNIAAVVFAFFTTTLYVIHTIFSALRWKSF
ncbi:myelin and lymphocyte protein-like [Rhinichthys klamathensis goyatoka]|uniref:myelin and lymphocyte protein-like n=1 Tax=Rhinichthys klamathensis goyatoka TaxID=3034132 RepID=UPI0024B5D8CF|nr:myelin and lymphocyte protein-like [Rhinichthys klamathensis goyatoka]